MQEEHFSEYFVDVNEILKLVAIGLANTEEQSFSSKEGILSGPEVVIFLQYIWTSLSSVLLYIVMIFMTLLQYILLNLPKQTIQQQQ